ncbi:GAF domain-containing protein [Patescibacteria group bacterium]|nr:GAF domain-containing protein [Patescibacteria group bacterium]
MTLLNILPLLSSIFVFWLGVFVISKNTKSVVHRVFFLLSISVTIWLIGTFMMFISKTNGQAIFWDRFIYMGVVFVPAFMYHFSVVWTKIKKQKTLIIISYILGFIFLILSRTQYFVDDIFKYNWGVHSQAKFFHHLFLLQFFFFLALVLYNFYKHYIENKNASKKNQSKYVFIAFFILITIGSTAYFPAYKISIYPFSYISGVLFTMILAYAIVAHHLMDIKLVLRNSFAYLAPLVTVLVGYTFVQYITNLYLADWIITTSNVAVLILSILFFIPLKNFYYHLANKYFFSSLYDSQEVLANLSEKLRSSLDTKIICDLISKTLINAFHSKAAGILIFDEKKNRYAVEYNYNFNIGAQKYFSNDKFLQNKFAGQNKILIVENIKNNLSYKKSQSTLELLNKLGIEILAPLNIKNKTIGLIVLGSKESNDMYNDEDLKVLQVVGAQTAVALQNSLRYQESLRFSEKLKQEVKIATQDLRKANQKLKILDKAKTEFISITSHQLRTPLTGIKGYLSMFLEGDFGALKTQQKKIITDVFNNSNRLVRLINVFLNVSRIESGRLKIEKKKFDLTELINEIIRELKIEAEKKNLKLEFINFKNKLKISADRDKIADVILNLVDNAIKYTEKGNVIVSAELKNNNIKVSIKDSGIGINPEEAKILFNKFIRGRKIAEINTSGSGLGLFIAKKIIELHNGKIWVESKGQGKGSEFIFEIPVK